MWYYHITYLFNLPSIAEEGLKPGFGQTFKGTWYESYAKGWLFLTSPKGVNYWTSRLRDHAHANTDHPEDGWVPVVLTFELPKNIKLEVDTEGSQDAFADAWKTRGAIPAAAIYIWDREDWQPIEEYNTEAVEEMLEEVKDAGEECFEEDDPECSWWELDFDYYLPPATALEE